MNTPHSSRDISRNKKRQTLSVAAAGLMIVGFAGGAWMTQGSPDIAPPFALSGTQAIHETNTTGAISAHTRNDLQKVAQDIKRFVDIERTGLRGAATEATQILGATSHPMASADKNVAAATDSDSQNPFANGSPRM